MRSAIVAMTLVAACGGTSARSPAAVTPSGPASHFLSIQHRSEMSASFELIRLRVTLDGAPLYGLEASDPRAETIPPLPMPVCAGRPPVQAGSHEIAIDLGYRGHGFGIFSYLRGYRFDVRSRTRVEVPADALGLVVTSTAYEAGGATAALEDRPHVRWDVHVERQQPSAGCFPAPGAGIGGQ